MRANEPLNSGRLFAFVANDTNRIIDSRPFAAAKTTCVVMLRIIADFLHLPESA